MGWSSKIPALVQRLEQADRQGLTAAQQVVLNQVKRDLRGGYTTGDFVTGASVSAATKSEPERTDTGHVGRVGTNLLYNLFWEIGFTPARGVFSPGMNRITQGPIQHQRKEIWVPALYSTRDQQIAAYRRVMLRALGNRGSVDVSAEITRTDEVPGGNE